MYNTPQHIAICKNKLRASAFYKKLVYKKLSYKKL